MAVRSAQYTSARTSRAVYPRTRRIRFRFNEEAGRKYFVAGDMVFSHFVAGLSGAFPPGEEGFIRSVRRFADQITDPELKKRVAGFIGQESMHGQEHRHLNEKLIAMGYPIAWWDSESFKDKRIRFEDRLPAHVHLALTAAAAAKKAELAKSWEEMSGGLPKMFEAIKSRLDILSQSKKLPADLDKAKLEGAKGGYEEAVKMWEDAKAAFAGGNLTDALAKGKTVKEKAAAVMTALGMQVPAAAAPAPAPAAAPKG